MRFGLQVKQTGLRLIACLLFLFVCLSAILGVLFGTGSTVFAADLEEQEEWKPYTASTFSPVVVLENGISPWASAIEFKAYAYQPELSTKTGAYFGARCGISYNSGQYVLPMTGELRIDLRDSSGAAPVTYKTQTWTYGGSGIQNTTPFIHTELGKWKPSVAGLNPDVTLSGDTVDGTTWSAGYYGHANKTFVYGRAIMTWRQNGGSVTLQPSSGQLVAVGTNSDADGFLGLPYTDVLKNAYIRVDTNSANTPVTAATATQDVTRLVDQGSVTNQTIYTDMDWLTSDQPTHTDQTVDFGTVDSAAGSYSTTVADAGKYLHVTFTTYGGNQTTKTVRIPNAYRIHYDSQGGSAVASSEAVFSGYNRQVTSIEPVRNGYKFLGWYTAPNQGGLKYEAGRSIKMENDVTLYAAWKIDHRIDTEVVNGTITESMSEIDAGSTKTITYQPKDGYRLQSITVDGRVLSAAEMERYSHAYTFSNIQGSHSIKVVYGKGYDITTIVENGWIDDSKTNVEEGTDVTIEYGPDDGCRLKQILVDGYPVNLEGFADSYEFTNIQQNHTIKVIYSPAFYVDTYVENGTITDPDFAVNPGDDKFIEYSANDGYQLKSIEVDGVLLSEDELLANQHHYLFSNVQADHEIRVIYEKVQTYMVTLEVEGGTTTTPEITDIAAGGSARIRWAKASTKHVMTSVTINGEAQDVDAWKSKTSWQFTDIHEDLHVKIVFAGDPVYRIDTDAEHGTIDAAKTGITSGSSVTVSYQPDAGYELSRIEVDGSEVPTEGNESQYKFTNVRENHTIYVVFTKIPSYTVTTSVEHGTITPTQTDVPRGDTVEIEYTPEAGYELESVTVDGGAVDISRYPDSYVFTDIQEDHDISVVFVPETTYTITTSVIHGQITETQTGVKKGSRVEIEYTGDVGCRLKSVTVDGLDLDLTSGQYDSSYVFDQIGGDHWIHVVYEEVTKYRVETSVEGGTISPSKTDLEAGDSYDVNYAPDGDKVLKSITVDDQPVNIQDFPDHYLFSDIQGNHKIHVVFGDPDLYQVTHSAEHGSSACTPEMGNGYRPGTDVEVSFEAEEGYHLASLTVDGESVSISGYDPHAFTYAFDNLQADHVIHAVFEADPVYQVETRVEGGTITPSKTDLAPGSQMTVEYQPNAGYELSSIEVDGEPVSIADYESQYVFADIQENHTIHVVFTKIPSYTVTTSVEHGTITPTVSDVQRGDRVEIQYAPEEGYELESVTVDGKAVDVSKYPDSYVFADVRADHTISVVFAPEATYSVTTSVEHGTISESVSGVKKGSDVTVTYAPDEGYKLVSILVDGAAVGLSGHEDAYVFENMQADHEIHVVFGRDFAVTTSVEGGTITPSNHAVQPGEDVLVEYAPEDENKYLESVTVDGEPVDLEEFPDSYPFEDVQESHSIHVVYRDYLKVTTEVEYGTISESVDRLKAGSDVTVTYGPESGYHLGQLLVDGVELSADELAQYGSAYEFLDIQENHHIKVVFVPDDTYSVNTSVVGGTITDSVSGIQAGSDVEITYAPNEGYVLKSITVDGNAVDVSKHPDSYVFANVQGNHEISVVYEKEIAVYDVSTKVTGGTITPDQLDVPEGTDVRIEYTPEDGYVLDRVIVDGKDVDVSKYPDSYVFPELDRDHMIEVVFQAVTYSVSTFVEHGVITDSVDGVKKGSDVTVMFSPEDGYVLEHIVIDGVPMDTEDMRDHYGEGGKDQSYVFSEISEDHTIRVVYGKKPEPAKDPTIEITKIIEDLDAVVYAKGTPVFTFHIYGTSEDGTRLDFYRTIELEPGSSVGKVRLTVPYGSYHITELSTHGWGVAEGTSDTVSLVVKAGDGDSAPVEQAVFTNRPVRYDSYTHNGLVVNELSR